MASAEENESKCEMARHVPASLDSQVQGGGEVRGAKGPDSDRQA